MEVKFKLIRELIDQKILFDVDVDGDLSIDGLSKSGAVTVEWSDDGGWTAYPPSYDRRHKVSSVNDLLNLAYVWYKDSPSDYKLPSLLQNREKYPPLKGEIFD